MLFLIQLTLSLNLKQVFIVNKISSIPSFSVFNQLLPQLSARQKKVLVVVSVAMAAIALLVLLLRNTKWNPFKAAPAQLPVPVLLPVSLPPPVKYALSQAPSQRGNQDDDLNPFEKAQLDLAKRVSLQDSQAPLYHPPRPPAHQAPQLPQAKRKNSFDASWDDDMKLDVGTLSRQLDAANKESLEAKPKIDEPVFAAPKPSVRELPEIPAISPAYLQQLIEDTANDPTLQLQVDAGLTIEEVDNQIAVIEHAVKIRCSLRIRLSQNRALESTRIIQQGTLEERTTYFNTRKPDETDKRLKKEIEELEQKNNLLLERKKELEA